MISKIVNFYINSFPNLQYQKGLCESYGLDVEYTQSYFRRMYRWFSLEDTLYTVTPKKRGSQTS